MVITAIYCPLATIAHLAHVADAGQIVNAFMAVLIGSFSLTMLGPDLQGEFVVGLTRLVSDGPTAITNGRGVAVKLFATIEHVPDIDSTSPEGLKPENVFGQITLEDVQFSYPARPDVPLLKGVSLTFEAGKTTALVSASGSGKLTIVSLVEHFYDPLSGSVKLDDIVLPELNLKWLRSQIGLVSQEPILFSMTIKENVAHGLTGSPYEHASDEEKFKLIKEVCIKSNADGFIVKLPQGYDTMVSERGFLLSGGQKQRVAIVCAIVSDPRILLLDEATSALDTQSEGIIQDALNKASTVRTTISIAHRLSTIKDVDQIFVMGEGIVLEQGTHQELLANEGPYTWLVQAQKLRESAETQATETLDDNHDDNIAAVSRSDKEKVDAKETPLEHQDTRSSLTSDLAHKQTAERRSNEVDKGGYSLFYLFRRIGCLACPWYPMYAIGVLCSIGKFLGQYHSSVTEPIQAAGMVYPVFSIIYGGFECRPSADINSICPRQCNCHVFWTWPHCKTPWRWHERFVASIVQFGQMLYVCWI